jgi:hypothetical protein
MKQELLEWEEEVAKVQSDLAQKIPDPSSGDKPFAFQTPGLKKAYSEALQAWNKDDTANALRLIDLANAGILKSAREDERFKWEGLRFRILLEQSDLKAAQQSYGMLKAMQPCSSDSAQAGFLMALLQFTNKDPKGATATLTAQCEPEGNDPGGARRKYWLARFTEGEGDSSTKQLSELAHTPIPSYYGLMAQVRLGSKLTLPAALPAVRGFLKAEFSVSGEVHRLLTAAEDRLRANLRRDASVFLTKASRRLRQENGPDNLVPLLYTAHLCHAAGNHLEAMRIYSKVSTELMDDEATANPLVSRALLSDMYPRPFQERVEWLSGMWKVDPDFVYAIIRQESAFNPTAVSSADARGLMQLMPWLGRALAKQWGGKNTYTDKTLFVADDNLKFGIFYLHQVQGYIPHLALTAASYNAGMTRVMNWWRRYGGLPLDVFIEMIPINETRSYVKLVMRNYYYYKMLRTNLPVDPSVIPFQLGPVPNELAKYTERTVLAAYKKKNTGRMRSR